jgi:HipA-like protein
MKGRVSFVYDERWRNADGAYLLSLSHSMPLILGEHGTSKTDPFLWGLLPDNEKVLDQWGNKFQVSSRNAFGLIAISPGGQIQSIERTREVSLDFVQPPEACVEIRN